MNSKRFTFGIVGIVGGLIVAIWLAAWLLPEAYYMNGEYGVWMQQKDYTESHHDGHPMLLLGDSRMKIDVNPQELGQDAYSLALAGSTPIEAYYSLQRYLKNNDSPSAVVIGFAPTHLMHMESYTNRGMYFHYYDLSTTNEINANILQLGGKDYRAEALQHEYRLPIIYLKGILHSIGKGNVEINKKSYQETASLSGGMILNGKISADKEVLPEETKDAGFVVLPILDYYLRETIDLCQQSNIPVRIIQLPMSEYGVSRLQKAGYYGAYQQYMTELRDKYGIPVEIDIPVYEHDDFADGSHLNAEGTKRFTYYLRQKIQHNAF